MLLDLDEFKQVNDAQGHAVGDELLAEVGRLLREQIRRADRAFRVGGDEFAILLPHTGADGAAQLARRVLATGLSVRATASYCAAHLVLGRRRVLPGARGDPRAAPALRGLRDVPRQAVRTDRGDGRRPGTRR